MNRNPISLAGALALLALAVTAIAFAAPAATSTKLSAQLDTKQEVPKPDATGGSGTFTGTVTGTSLKWKLSFKGLTGAAGAAHIHLALKGKANPTPAVSLCGPCKSGQTGSAKVTAAVLKKIKAGGAYVNVHTEKNAAGEIRGQLKTG
jgi:Cu/Zn superoxide dismutase